MISYSAYICQEMQDNGNQDAEMLFDSVLESLADLGLDLGNAEKIMLYAEINTQVYLASCR